MDDSTPGEIAIGLQANDFTRSCQTMTGTIVYDSSLSTVTNYVEADWMKQGGALPTFAANQAANNAIAVTVSRPTSFSGATGSGVAIGLIFKPVSAASRGTSPIQWTNAHCYGVNFVDVLASTYNGSITIQ